MTGFVSITNAFNALGMKGTDIRDGWSANKASGKFEIAVHRGKGRKPRLQFITNEDLATVRERMNNAGAKLGPITEVSDNVFKIFSIVLKPRY